MRWPAALLLVMACTEHGKGGGDEWDVRAIGLAEALCQNTCVPADQQEQCLADVLMDMDQARIELAASAEAQCIECMRVRIEVMPQIVANGCQAPAPIEDQITAACGQFQEACAGFP